MGTELICELGRHNQLFAPPAHCIIHRRLDKTEDLGHYILFSHPRVGRAAEAISVKLLTGCHIMELDQFITM